MRRLLALLLLTAMPAAHAAESYDACAGFIDALPANITTQGTWCLRKDLSTAMTSGAAITIATNNVTIDCNGFKLGGLAAGPTTQAAAIFAPNRLNITVRHCALRGFRHGVYLSGYATGGHVVEDNRMDQILGQAVFMHGEGNLVQRNRIIDTGDVEDGGAIHASADVIDNTVDGVIGANSTAISVLGAGSEVRGNRVRNVQPGSSAIVLDAHQSAVDNRILGRADGVMTGNGIFAPATSVCRGNLIANLETGIAGGCIDGGGNVVH